MPIFPNDQFATFIMAATVGSFAVEFVYLMLAVAMIWVLRTDAAANRGST